MIRNLLALALIGIAILGVVNLVIAPLAPLPQLSLTDPAHLSAWFDGATTALVRLVFGAIGLGLFGRVVVMLFARIAR